MPTTTFDPTTLSPELQHIADAISRVPDVARYAGQRQGMSEEVVSRLHPEDHDDHEMLALTTAFVHMANEAESALQAINEQLRTAVNAVGDASQLEQLASILPAVVERAGSARHAGMQAGIDLVQRALGDATPIDVPQRLMQLDDTERQQRFFDRAIQTYDDRVQQLPPFERDTLIANTQQIIPQLEQYGQQIQDTVEDRKLELGRRYTAALRGGDMAGMAAAQAEMGIEEKHPLLALSNMLDSISETGIGGMRQVLHALRQTRSASPNVTAHFAIEQQLERYIQEYDRAVEQATLHPRGTLDDALRDMQGQTVSPEKLAEVFERHIYDATHMPLPIGMDRTALLTTLQQRYDEAQQAYDLFHAQHTTGTQSELIDLGHQMGYVHELERLSKPESEVLAQEYRRRAEQLIFWRSAAGNPVNAQHIVEQIQGLLPNVTGAQHQRLTEMLGELQKLLTVPRYTHTRTSDDHSAPLAAGRADQRDSYRIAQVTHMEAEFEAIQEKIAHRAQYPTRPVENVTAELRAARLQARKQAMQLLGLNQERYSDKEWPDIQRQIRAKQQEAQRATMRYLEERHEQLEQLRAQRAAVVKAQSAPVRSSDPTARKVLTYADLIERIARLPDPSKLVLRTHIEQDQRIKGKGPVDVPREQVRQVRRMLTDAVRAQAAQMKTAVQGATFKEVWKSFAPALAQQVGMGLAAHDVANGLAPETAFAQYQLPGYELLDRLRAKRMVEFGGRGQATTMFQWMQDAIAQASLAHRVQFYDRQDTNALQEVILSEAMHLLQQRARQSGYAAIPLHDEIHRLLPPLVKLSIFDARSMAFGDITNEGALDDTFADEEDDNSDGEKAYTVALPPSARNIVEQLFPGTDATRRALESGDTRELFAVRFPYDADRDRTDYLRPVRADMIFQAPAKGPIKRSSEDEQAMAAIDLNEDEDHLPSDRQPYVSGPPQAWYEEWRQQGMRIEAQAIGLLNSQHLHTLTPQQKQLLYLIANAVKTGHSFAHLPPDAVVEHPNMKGATETHYSAGLVTVPDITWLNEMDDLFPQYTRNPLLAGGAPGTGTANQAINLLRNMPAGILPSLPDGTADSNDPIYALGKVMNRTFNQPEWTPETIGQAWHTLLFGGTQESADTRSGRQIWIEDLIHRPPQLQGLSSLKRQRLRRDPYGDNAKIRLRRRQVAQTILGLRGGAMAEFPNDSDLDVFENEAFKYGPNPDKNYQLARDKELSRIVGYSFGEHAFARYETTLQHMEDRSPHMPLLDGETRKQIIIGLAGVMGAAGYGSAYKDIDVEDERDMMQQFLTFVRTPSFYRDDAAVTDLLTHLATIGRYAMANQTVNIYDAKAALEKMGLRQRAEARFGLAMSPKDFAELSVSDQQAVVATYLMAPNISHAFLPGMEEAPLMVMPAFIRYANEIFEEHPELQVKKGPNKSKYFGVPVGIAYLKGLLGNTFAGMVPLPVLRALEAERQVNSHTEFTQEERDRLRRYVGTLPDNIAGFNYSPVYSVPFEANPEYSLTVPGTKVKVPFDFYDEVQPLTPTLRAQIALLVETGMEPEEARNWLIANNNIERINAQRGTDLPSTAMPTPWGPKQSPKTLHTTVRTLWVDLITDAIDALQKSQVRPQSKVLRKQHIQLQQQRQKSLEERFAEFQQLPQRFPGWHLEEHLGELFTDTRNLLDVFHDVSRQYAIGADMTGEEPSFVEGLSSTDVPGMFDEMQLPVFSSQEKETDEDWEHQRATLSGLWDDLRAVKVHHRNEEAAIRAANRPTMAMELLALQQQTEQQRAKVRQQLRKALDYMPLSTRRPKANVPSQWTWGRADFNLSRLLARNVDEKRRQRPYGTWMSLQEEIAQLRKRNPATLAADLKALVKRGEQPFVTPEMRAAIAARKAELQAGAPAQIALPGIYAGLGARGTVQEPLPSEIVKIMERIGKVLGAKSVQRQTGVLMGTRTIQGVTVPTSMPVMGAVPVQGRGGFARGSDMAFMRGAQQAQGYFTNFLPEEDFNSHSAKYGYEEVLTPALRQAVEDSPYYDMVVSALGYDPRVAREKPGKNDAFTRNAMARNVLQIMGLDLHSPVEAVFAYTPDGIMEGGSRAAIGVAKGMGIPVHNLGDREQLIEILAWLDWEEGNMGTDSPPSGPSPLHFGQRASNDQTTALYPNRQQDRADVERRLHIGELGDDTTVFHTKEGQVFATGYQRIVYGDHGPYLEFDPAQVSPELHPLIKKRGKADRYYDWVYPGTEKDLKVYRQLRTVADRPDAPPRSDGKPSAFGRKEGYADYKPGMIYVGVNDLLPQSTRGRAEIEGTAEPPVSPPPQEPVYFGNGQNTWLSNFGTGVILTDQGGFQTREHAYQASKFRHRSDIIEKIRAAKTPKEAKAIAHQHKQDIAPGWQNVAAMEQMLERAIQQIPGLEEQLLATGTREIIEISQKDSFWGKVSTEAGLEGQNQLGQIYMRLRTRYAKSASTDQPTGQNDARIYHVKKTGGKPVSYVGRKMPGIAGSPFGNPFSVKEYGRDKAINMYASYLTHNPALLSQLSQLQRDLACWCAPAGGLGMSKDEIQCHAQVIAAARASIEEDPELMHQAMQLAKAVRDRLGLPELPADLQLEVARSLHLETLDSLETAPLLDDEGNTLSTDAYARTTRSIDDELLNPDMAMLTPPEITATTSEAVSGEPAQQSAATRRGGRTQSRAPPPREEALANYSAYIEALHAHTEQLNALQARIEAALSDKDTVLASQLIDQYDADQKKYSFLRRRFKQVAADVKHYGIALIGEDPRDSVHPHKLQNDARRQLAAMKAKLASVTQASGPQISSSGAGDRKPPKKRRTAAAMFEPDGADAAAHIPLTPQPDEAATSPTQPPRRAPRQPRRSQPHTAAFAQAPLFDDSAMLAQLALFDGGPPLPPSPSTDSYQQEQLHFGDLYRQSAMQFPWEVASAPPLFDDDGQGSLSQTPYRYQPALFPPTTPDQFQQPALETGADAAWRNADTLNDPRYHLAAYSRTTDSEDDALNSAAYGLPSDISPAIQLPAYRNPMAQFVDTTQQMGEHLRYSRLGRNFQHALYPLRRQGRRLGQWVNRRTPVALKNLLYSTVQSGMVPALTPDQLSMSEQMTLRQHQQEYEQYQASEQIRAGMERRMLPPTFHMAYDAQREAAHQRPAWLPQYTTPRYQLDQLRADIQGRHAASQPVPSGIQPPLFAAGSYQQPLFDVPPPQAEIPSLSSEAPPPPETPDVVPYHLPDDEQAVPLRAQTRGSVALPPPTAAPMSAKEIALEEHRLIVEGVKNLRIQARHYAIELEEGHRTGNHKKISESIDSLRSVQEILKNDALPEYLDNLSTLHSHGIDTSALFDHSYSDHPMNLHGTIDKLINNAGLPTAAHQPSAAPPSQAPGTTAFHNPFIPPVSAHPAELNDVLDFAGQDPASRAAIQAISDPQGGRLFTLNAGGGSGKSHTMLASLLGMAMTGKAKRSLTLVQTRRQQQDLKGRLQGMIAGINQHDPRRINPSHHEVLTTTQAIARILLSNKTADELWRTHMGYAGKPHDIAESHPVSDMFDVVTGSEQDMMANTLVNQLGIDPETNAAHRNMLDPRNLDDMIAQANEVFEKSPQEAHTAVSAGESILSDPELMEKLRATPGKLQSGPILAAGLLRQLKASRSTTFSAMNYHFGQLVTNPESHTFLQSTENLPHQAVAMDEIQDASPVKAALLHLLGQGRTVVTGGDVYQQKDGMMARPFIHDLSQFVSTLFGQPTETHNLPYNHRSRPGFMRLNNWLNRERKDPLTDNTQFSTRYKTVSESTPEDYARFVTTPNEFEKYRVMITRGLADAGLSLDTARNMTEEDLPHLDPHVMQSVGMSVPRRESDLHVFRQVAQTMGVPDFLFTDKSRTRGLSGEALQEESQLEQHRIPIGTIAGTQGLQFQHQHVDTQAEWKKSRTQEELDHNRAYNRTVAVTRSVGDSGSLTVYQAQNVQPDYGTYRRTGELITRPDMTTTDLHGNPVEVKAQRRDLPLHRPSDLLHAAVQGDIEQFATDQWMGLHPQGYSHLPAEHLSALQLMARDTHGAEQLATAVQAHARGQAEANQQFNPDQFPTVLTPSKQSDITAATLQWILKSRDVEQQQPTSPNERLIAGLRKERGSAVDEHLAALHQLSGADISELISGVSNILPLDTLQLSSNIEGIGKLYDFLHQISSPTLFGTMPEPAPGMVSGAVTPTRRPTADEITAQDQAQGATTTSAGSNYTVSQNAAGQTVINMGGGHGGHGGGGYSGGSGGDYMSQPYFYRTSSGSPRINLKRSAKDITRTAFDVSFPANQMRQEEAQQLIAGSALRQNEMNASGYGIQYTGSGHGAADAYWPVANDPTVQQIQALTNGTLSTADIVQAQGMSAASFGSQATPLQIAQLTRVAQSTGVPLTQLLPQVGNVAFTMRNGMSTGGATAAQVAATAMSFGGAYGAPDVMSAMGSMDYGSMADKTNFLQQWAAPNGYATPSFAQGADMYNTLQQMTLTPSAGQQLALGKLFFPTASSPTQANAQLQQLTGSFGSPELAQQQASLTQQNVGISQLAAQIALNIPNLQVGVEQQQQQMDVVQHQYQGFQLGQANRDYQFGLNIANQQYGQIGADHSRAAYLAFQQSQAAAQYDPLHGDMTATNLSSTPQFGLQDQIFYASAEHQRSSMLYGRSALTSDMAFKENLNYLKKQEDFYVAQRKIQDEQRAYERTKGAADLAWQAKMYAQGTKVFEAQQKLDTATIAYHSKTEDYMKQQLGAMEEIRDALLHQMSGDVGINLTPTQILAQVVKDLQSGQKASDLQKYLVQSGAMTATQAQAMVQQAQVIVANGGMPSTQNQPTKSTSDYLSPAWLKQFGANGVDVNNQVNATSTNNQDITWYDTPSFQRMGNAYTQADSTTAAIASNVQGLNDALTLITGWIEKVTPLLILLGGAEMAMGMGGDFVNLLKGWFGKGNSPGGGGSGPIGGGGGGCNDPCSEDTVKSIVNSGANVLKGLAPLAALALIPSLGTYLQNLSNNSNTQVAQQQKQIDYFTQLLKQLGIIIPSDKPTQPINYPPPPAQDPSQDPTRNDKKKKKTQPTQPEQPPVPVPVPAKVPVRYKWQPTRDPTQDPYHANRYVAKPSSNQAAIDKSVNADIAAAAAARAGAPPAPSDTIPTPSPTPSPATTGANTPELNNWGQLWKNLQQVGGDFAQWATQSPPMMNDGGQYVNNQGIPAVPQPSNTDPYIDPIKYPPPAGVPGTPDGPALDPGGAPLFPVEVPIGATNGGTQNGLMIPGIGDPSDPSYLGGGSGSLIAIVKGLYDQNLKTTGTPQRTGPIVTGGNLIVPATGNLHIGGSDASYLKQLATDFQNTFKNISTQTATQLATIFQQDPTPSATAWTKAAGGAIQDAMLLNNPTLINVLLSIYKNDPTKSAAQWTQLGNLAIQDYLTGGMDQLGLTLLGLFNTSPTAKAGAWSQWATEAMQAVLDKNMPPLARELLALFGTDPTTNAKLWASIATDVINQVLAGNIDPLTQQLLNIFIDSKPAAYQVATDWATLVGDGIINSLMNSTVPKVQADLAKALKDTGASSMSSLMDSMELSIALYGNPFAIFGPAAAATIKGDLAAVFQDMLIQMRKENKALSKYGEQVDQATYNAIMDLEAILDPGGQPTPPPGATPPSPSPSGNGSGGGGGTGTGGGGNMPNIVMPTLAGGIAVGGTTSHTININLRLDHNGQVTMDSTQITLPEAEVDRVGSVILTHLQDALTPLITSAPYTVH